jgi:hypothetical protein
MNLMDDKGSLWIRVRRKKYTGCLKIRELRIQSVVGDHFSSPNMEIKKKSGLPPSRYIGLKVHFLNWEYRVSQN